VNADGLNSFAPTQERGYCWGK